MNNLLNKYLLSQALYTVKGIERWLRQTQSLLLWPLVAINPTEVMVLFHLYNT